MLAITVCATGSYTYAMRAQARRVAANCGNGGKDTAIILVGDSSQSLQEVAAYYRFLMPSVRIDLHPLPNLSEDNPNYKQQAQMVIARMRDEAFARARAHDADECWSLDSDTLPPQNALRCMRDMLKFDDGYYSVSTCPYPNSAFLGGFGTRYNPIAEDFLPHERKVPEELMAEFKANEEEGKELAKKKEQPSEEIRKKWEATSKKIRECPPDGTIWEVIAKHGWRRRGWLDNAYPGIGLGAVVPSDWCGFGCTLMNKEALSLAYFDGYDGRGTEDLFICWHRWHPAGLRLNVIPHAPCDHVIWDKKKGGDSDKYVLHHSYHEQDGEFRGHLRVRQIPWNPEVVTTSKPNVPSCSCCGPKTEIKL